MDISNCYSISGKPGLFKMLSQSKTGAVMESIVDGKRLPVFINDKISSLGEISMFTTGEDVPLKIVLQNIFRKENKEKTSVSPKDNDPTLQNWFSEILPEWDQERIYVSDIKKVVAWYNILIDNNLIDLEENSSETEL